MNIYTKFGRMTAWLGCAGMLLLPPGLRCDPIGYEVVGQVLNPTAQQSLQYGYLNLVRGLDRVTTLTGVAVSETSALFTFYNDTTTERVINNGSMRLVDRTGSGAIYFGPGNADFANPDTFRNGNSVQTYTLRHQVVIDTSTGYFTTTFEMTITSAKTFQMDGKTYRLGHPGETYRLNVSGKLTTQGPPSAYIAGAADGGGVDPIQMN